MSGRAEGTRDGGFTLVELLVVMIIVGILVGIALPVFINQRGKAVDSSLKADVRNIAAVMESYYSGNQTYVAPAQSGREVSVGTGDTVTVSSGTTVSVVPLSAVGGLAGAWASAEGFCITASNPRGHTSGGVRFNSLTGGLTTAPCPS